MMSKICFFCNKEVSDEKVKNHIGTYFLCDECHEKMDEGVSLISISNKPAFEKQGQIFNYNIDGEETPMYPTGEWAVFSENTISEFFGDKAEQIINQKIGFVLPEVFDQIKKIYKEVKERSEEND